MTWRHFFATSLGGHIREYFWTHSRRDNRDVLNCYTELWFCHCRGEAARCFMSLNISRSHSRSLEVTPLSRACVSPYKYFISTMALSRTVSEIFSIRYWHDLKIWVRGHSRSLEMVPFHRSHTIVFHCNYGHILYHFRNWYKSDKLSTFRHWSKSANFYRASAYWRAILIQQICPSVRPLRSGIVWKRLNV